MVADRRGRGGSLVVFSQRQNGQAGVLKGLANQPLATAR